MAAKRLFNHRPHKTVRTEMARTERYHFDYFAVDAATLSGACKKLPNRGPIVFLFGPLDDDGLLLVATDSNRSQAIN